jgi:hypothetical protein
MNVCQNQQTTSDAERQAEKIDEGINFVFAEISQGDDEVVFEHE